MVDDARFIERDQENSQAKYSLTATLQELSLRIRLRLTPDL
jgi:hypothetical protein